MTLNETFQEINQITIKLVELGLSVKQNFPYRNNHIISFGEGGSVTNLLKNVSYEEKYNFIDLAGKYNFKFLDGALVQLMYTFDRSDREITSHRLAFLPAPNFINYDEDPEAYEHLYYGNSEFHDLISRNIIKTPIRFDFNSEDKKHIDIQHPKSHLHIGEYEGCRIPVVEPVSPSIFINFLIRNFYNSALINQFKNYSFPVNFRFRGEITSNESEILHLSIGSMVPLTAKEIPDKHVQGKSAKRIRK